MSRLCSVEFELDKYYLDGDDEVANSFLTKQKVT